MSSRTEDLARIEAGLDAALSALAPFTPGRVSARFKSGDDPVTEADLAVNDVLSVTLPRSSEGWLSEETADDAVRLGCERVWVVDPIDGTREFVAGIPEWCVSIGLIESGRPVAGGVVNPATGERIVGSVDSGLRYTGNRPPRDAGRLEDAVVLASRSETGRGEWQRFEHERFTVVPMGSVAFKLALVAAGRADATWTLIPKHEWDVAAGAALIAASGGLVAQPDGRHPVWNRPVPRLDGLIAATPALSASVARFFGWVPLEPDHAQAG
jgi:myo-inositol-1(or 4)-monophosphatase